MKYPLLLVALLVSAIILPEVYHHISLDPAYAGYGYVESNEKILIDKLRAQNIKELRMTATWASGEVGRFAPKVLEEKLGSLTKKQFISEFQQFLAACPQGLQYEDDWGHKAETDSFESGVEGFYKTYSRVGVGREEFLTLCENSGVFAREFAQKTREEIRISNIIEGARCENKEILQLAEDCCYTTTRTPDLNSARKLLKQVRIGKLSVDERVRFDELEEWVKDN